MIKDVAMNAGGGTAEKHRAVRLVTAVAQTDLITDIVQIGTSFTVERVMGYCSAETGAVTADVSVVRPGTVFTSPTMAIGTDVKDFQVAAFSALGKITTAGVLPTIVRKAAQDNIAFSQAFVIGTGTGQHWGACRVQMTSAGVISTKVSGLALSFPSEALAIADAPAADSDKINLGTISIRTANNAQFTAGTDDLNGADVATVNYNNADGLVPVAADIAFVALTAVSPTITAGGPQNRGVSQPGGLIVTRYTSDGTGALTNGLVDITYRPWPLNTEAGN